MCIVICTLLQSRPARGAWIETLPGFRYRIPPQKGSLCRLAETSFHFSILLIKAWVYVVDVFLVQAVLGEAQAFTKAYKMEITSL